MPEQSWDAVVVGSGPNGLAAAIVLAQSGASVLLLEAKETVGGGMRTAELTLPGFHHDVCSACHPMGVLSPFFRSLPLEEHGLRWVRPAASVAHPLDGEPAVMLWRDLERTADGLGVDAGRYRALIGPLLHNPHGLLEDVLGPLGLPRHPLQMARFGLRAAWPATLLGRWWFKGERARALLAGCAAHAIQPLENPLTAALGVLFLLTGHMDDWPVAAGGSQAIADALAGVFRSLGGTIQTGHPVHDLRDLPPTRVVVLDTDPAQLASIGGPILPERYVRRLRRYRYGPGAFKLDFALDGPIPWSDPSCLEASTVHLGGSLDAIAAAERSMYRGGHPTDPYVLVVQQSQFDPSRAPDGQHTGYAYIHVPSGSGVDCSEIIIRQIERFAPGFRDRILALKVTDAPGFAAYSRNYVGGAITGGVADMWQLFTRPVARLDPYSTPNPRLYIGSASTPPGGGVHGMCGVHAARSALRRLHRLEPVRLG